MKRLQISMVALIAIVAGVALSAFTPKPLVTPKSLTVHYYQFTGSDNSNGQIQASGNWTDLGTGAPTLTCNKTSGIVCFLHYDGALSAFQTYVSSQTLSTLQSAQIIDEYRQ